MVLFNNLASHPSTFNYIVSQTENSPIANDPFAALRYREFRNYAIARFFFIFTLNMQITLIYWKVYEITKKEFSIGLIGLIEFIPAFCLAFYSGYLIDKADKRTLLLRSIIGNVVCTAALCFVTSAFALQQFSTSTNLLIIYAIVFCIGLLRPFSGPTSFALLTQLVPKEIITNATTWHTGIWQVGAVAGPAVGGILYASVGITNTFYLMLLFLSIAVTGMYFIEKKPILNKERNETIVESVVKGFRFVWHTKEVLGAISLDLFAVLFGGAVALLPAYADKILHVGAKGLGMLRSAPALGAVLVLILLTFQPLKKKQGIIMLWCVAGFGICTIVFGVSKFFWLSLGMLFLAGALDGISVIVRSTILQLKTPDDMRGRVAAVSSIFIMSSNELGAFESGITANWLGLVPAVVVGGCLTIAVVAFTFIKAPSLRKLEY